MSDQETPNETAQPPDQLEEEEGAEHEETEPETHDGQEGEPSEESEDASEGKQEGDATTAPVAATAGAAANAQKVTWKEDLLDFDESTIEIAVTLYPLKGRPADERIVTICIHNHSGTPLYDSARQSELSEKSALDGLQGWIARNVKKFRADLSRRKQQQWEAEQERKQSKIRSRPAATPGNAALGTTAPATVPGNAALSQESGAPSPHGTATPAQARVPATPSDDKTTKAAAAKQGEPELVQHSLF